jgi:hypothetical protein
MQLLSRQLGARAPAHRSKLEVGKLQPLDDRDAEGLGRFAQADERLVVEPPGAACRDHPSQRDDGHQHARGEEQQDTTTDAAGEERSRFHFHR